MATTYDKIATTTMAGSAVSVTFSSIAATYTDLRLVVVATTSVADSISLQFNGDNAANYSLTILNGNGATATSTRSTGTSKIYTNNNLSTTIPKLYTADIFSYAGSTYKTALISMAGDTNGTGSIETNVGLWRSTSAITQVVVGLGSGNLTGTATLYGILKA
jgi:hypothetical protein